MTTGNSLQTNLAPRVKVSKELSTIPGYNCKQNLAHEINSPLSSCQMPSYATGVGSAHYCLCPPMVYLLNMKGSFMLNSHLADDIYLWWWSMTLESHLTKERSWQIFPDDDPRHPYHICNCRIRYIRKYWWNSGVFGITVWSISFHSFIYLLITYLFT